MNERIKELLSEAKIYDGSTTQNITTCPSDLEKFAELIVRECAKVCADRGKHHDGLYSAWANDCSERIGKHFGVEE